ncbi:hypothetical protein SOVF_098420 [Spinacia oleracea]|nr:hypothetical protein SOVF_098420 [Spinacia oleracea]
MASEAPTWADQWGEGGFGAMDEAKPTEKVETKKKKTAFLGGFGAKVAAMVGIKLGKQQGVKKNPPPE